MVSGVADVFGVLAAVLTTLFAWPQAVRAWRARRTPAALAPGGAGLDGISLGTTGLMALSGLLWSLYGARTGSAYILVANLSVFSAALLTAVACRERIAPRLRVVGLAGGALAGLVALLAGPVPNGLMGDVVAGLMTLPQAALALRGGASLAAVSPATYALLAANAACWIAYGVAIADPLVVAPNCISLPASLLILFLRHRAARATPHGSGSSPLLPPSRRSPSPTSTQGARSEK